MYGCTSIKEQILDYTSYTPPHLTMAQRFSDYQQKSKFDIGPWITDTSEKFFDDHPGEEFYIVTPSDRPLELVLGNTNTQTAARKRNRTPENWRQVTRKERNVGYESAIHSQHTSLAETPHIFLFRSILEADEFIDYLIEETDEVYYRSTDHWWKPFHIAAYDSESLKLLSDRYNDILKSDFPDEKFTGIKWTIVPTRICKDECDEIDGVRWLRDDKKIPEDHTEGHFSIKDINSYWSSKSEYAFSQNVLSYDLGE